MCTFRKLFARKLVKESIVPAVLDSCADALNLRNLLYLKEEMIVAPLINNSVKQAQKIVQEQSSHESVMIGVVRCSLKAISHLHSEAVRHKKQIDYEQAEAIRVEKEKRDKFLAEKRQLKRKKRSHEAKEKIFFDFQKTYVESSKPIKKNYIHHEKRVMPSDWQEKDLMGVGMLLDLFPGMLTLISQIRNPARERECIRRVLDSKADITVSVDEGIASFFNSLAQALTSTPVETLSANLSSLVDNYIENSNYLKFLTERSFIESAVVHSFFQMLFQFASAEEAKPILSIAVTPDNFGMFLANTKYILRINRRLSAMPRQEAAENDLKSLDEEESIYQYDGSIEEARERLFGFDEAAENPLKISNFGGEVYMLNRIGQEEIMRRVVEMGLNEEGITLADALRVVRDVERSVVERLRADDRVVLVYDYYA